AHLLRQPAALPDTRLTDRGAVPAPVGTPASRTSGVLLHRHVNGDNETGLWVCTPGTWRCKVSRDEFCQFLSGRCIYTEDGGAVTEIAGGDAAFFPAGWRGTCQVLNTVRKTCMIR
ncbi:MAG: cupin domain-containing protein, partial [bacterium]|nr:cupin domain-containing protein [bacterium]